MTPRARATIIKKPKIKKNKKKRKPVGRQSLLWLRELCAGGNEWLCLERYMGSARSKARVPASRHSELYTKISGLIVSCAGAYCSKLAEPEVRALAPADNGYMN